MSLEELEFEHPDIKESKKIVPVGVFSTVATGVAIATSAAFGTASAFTWIPGILAGKIAYDWVKNSLIYKVRLPRQCPDLVHYTPDQSIQYWMERDTNEQKKLREEIIEKSRRPNFIFETLLDSIGWLPPNPTNYFAYPQGILKEENINICRLIHAEKMLRLIQKIEDNVYEIPDVDFVVRSEWYPHTYGIGRGGWRDKTYLRDLGTVTKIKPHHPQFQDNIKSLLKEYWEIEIKKQKEILGYNYEDGEGNWQEMNDPRLIPRTWRRVEN